MLFCSLQFLVFFLIVFALYWLAPWQRARVVLLVAASVVFYGSWNGRLALLVCATSVLDYFLAIAMEEARSTARRRLLLILSLAVNLGLLVYLKYANFFLDSLAHTLHVLGSSASLPVLQVILPIGISFYTFEAINYSVDVYRGRLRAERDLLSFLLFILFFPHLIAGPIVRARDFLPLVRRAKRWSWPRMNLGVQLFILGMFKKMAIADRMPYFVDPVFAQPENFSGLALWLATLAYALQIYCDFSGYSDMAIGSAHLLGYRLARNFHAPYLAPNIAEMWRRWHISLSSWLRDYLFIPLGGSRGSRWATFRNLLLVMTLGGLWHGANWTFVVWGALIGIMLIVHREFRDAVQRFPAVCTALDSAPGTVARILLTFAAVCVTWVFFRATGLDVALLMLGRMFRFAPGAELPLPLFGLALATIVVFVEQFIVSRPKPQEWLHVIPVPMRGLGYASMIALALLLVPTEHKAFIYFQF